MGKWILLIGILFCNVQAILGQEIKISQKEEFNFYRDQVIVLGKYKGQTVVYKNHASIGELLFYDSAMQKTQVSTLAFLPEKASNIRFGCSEQDILICYQLNDKKMQAIYINKLRNDLTWQEPTEICTNWKKESNAKNNATIHFSEDQRSVLVSTSYMDDGILYLLANTYDSQLQARSTIQQAYTDKNYLRLYSATLTNEGAIALLATDQTVKSKANKEEVYLLYASVGSTLLDSIRLSIGNYSVQDICLLQHHEQQQIYIAAFFADGKYSSAVGLYYCVFSEEQKKIVATHYTPLALQSVGTKNDLRNLTLKQISVSKQGHIECITEKSSHYSRTLSSLQPMVGSSILFNNLQDNARIVQEYVFEEIVLFNIKADGTLAWSQTILKDQTTQDDEGVYSSYVCLQYPNGKVYFFNDLSGRAWRLLGAYVSSAGELSVKELQTYDAMRNWNVLVSQGKQISGKEMLVPCITKNYLCFLKISY